MLEKSWSGNNQGKTIKAEHCKPDFEEIIALLREEVVAAINFRDSALAYFKGVQAQGAMAELIGELVTRCNQIELELSNLIKRQEMEASLEGSRLNRR